MSSDAGEPMIDPDAAAAETERDLPDPAREVWESITTCDGFERWMGEGSSIEPTRGGTVIATDPESGEPKIGVVTDVEPIRRLEWAWRPLGEPDETATEVEITLTPNEQGTRVVVVERPTTYTVALPAPPAARALSSLSTR